MMNNRMTIVDFLNDDLFNLPKIQSAKQDFKQFVFRHLDAFIQKIEEFSNNQTHFADVYLTRFQG